MVINARYLYINTVRDYIEAFELFSGHNFRFANSASEGTMGEILPDLPCANLDGFDAILVHYSSRVCFGDSVFRGDVKEAIRRFQGFKALFLQDEYDNTEMAREWILEQGIDHVFTCVPEAFIGMVYPSDRFPGVKFTTVLTGYVPDALMRRKSPPPLDGRPYWIVYRGREMEHYRGELAREKVMIGKRVRRECEARGIPADIEWEEDQRLYGMDWDRFLESGRTTLGTESGSNVFDLDGSIAVRYRELLAENPDLKFEDVSGSLFEEVNLGVKMNQVSPKFFEFIAARTALVLFEGEYSGILEPERHYLPLRKDYSNLDEIFEALHDLPRLERMVDRCYREIVEAGGYGYREFVRGIDRVIESAIGECLAPRISGDLETLSADYFSSEETIELRSIFESGLPQFEALLDERQQKIANFEGMVARREEKIAALSRKLEKQAGNKRRSPSPLDRLKSFFRLP